MITPFYFQIRYNGAWHTGVAVRKATKTAIARCGTSTNWLRPGYRDLETLPYSGAWCKQCQKTEYTGIPESY